MDGKNNADKKKPVEEYPNSSMDHKVIKPMTGLGLP